MSKVAKQKVCNIDGEDVEVIVHNAIILVDKSAANMVKLGKDELPNKPNKTVGWSPESRPDPDSEAPLIPARVGIMPAPTFKIVWKDDDNKGKQDE